MRERLLNGDRRSYVEAKDCLKVRVVTLRLKDAISRLKMLTGPVLYSAIIAG
jgi:hypothetical protein